MPQTTAIKVHDQGTQLTTAGEATRDFILVFLTNWSGTKSLKGTLMTMFENYFRSHKCSICVWKNSIPEFHGLSILFVVKDSV